MSDYIDRRAAIDAVNGMPDCPNGYSDTYDKAAIIGILEDVPSVEELKNEALETAYLEGYTAGQNAQPKYVALHESCTDCPLYDHDRHSCPRFNKVIPRTIEEVKPRWIPIKWHNCTDEEREEYGFAEEVVAVFDCDMPNDNQEILVTTSHGYVEKDVCYIDDGYSLDSGYDWIEDIIAWTPLPEPYAERRQE